MEEGGGEKVRIGDEGVGSGLLVEVGERDAVGHLDGEPEVISYSIAVCRYIEWIGEPDLIGPEEGPEPLVDFHRVVLAGVFLQVVDALRGGVYQLVPGWVFPTARADSEFWHDHFLAETTSTGKPHIDIPTTSSGRNPLFSNAFRTKIGRQSTVLGNLSCAHS